MNRSLGSLRTHIESILVYRGLALAETSTGENMSRSETYERTNMPEMLDSSKEELRPCRLHLQRSPWKRNGEM